MKYKPKAWRLIWRFLLTMLVILIIVLLASSDLFIDLTSWTFKTWDYRQPLLIGTLFGVGFIAFIPSITSYYFTIEDKYFTVRKYGKTYEYTYENIEFIDEEKSEKKQMVIFYSTKAKMVYLFQDEKNVLYKTLKKKCKNRLSREEFYKRHPEER